MATIEERKAKLAQRKARAQKEEAAIRKAERTQDTRRKILSGALSITRAHEEPAYREQYLANVRKKITKASDLAVMQPLIDELEGMSVEVIEESPDEFETMEVETPRRNF